ncbi:MAG TPA: hypothetical protein VFF36_11585 [Planctomycetota bacterium]|nr:hypothetical protein [Planctomycetota bacterium]
MKTMILSFVFLSQILPNVAAQVDSLPGSAYSMPAKGVALRSDANQDFPQVFSLDGQTVVRIGALKGTFREVFVPQGFPVYMHGEYLDIDAAGGTAMVAGDRVNMRLLPSTDGLLPIGQLSRPTGPLVVLEQAGDWVRVLAPVQVPLYALDTEVPATTDAGAAERWRSLYASRDGRRAATVAAVRKDRKTEEPAAASERQALEQVDPVHSMRTTADVSTAKVAQAQTAPAAPAVSAAPDALQRKESRLLLLGFRYKGKGLPVTREGVVQIEGPAAAPLYTLRGSDGEVLKLTAPAEVAKLADLAGKRVTLDGRRLFLGPVDGPVLVIDRVTLPEAN